MKTVTCNLCGPLAAHRAKIRDGLCGRCYSATIVKPSPRGRERAKQVARAYRARVGGKATLWVAFRRGDAVGVYSAEAKALAVSNVVRSFKINRIPQQ